MNRRWTVVMLWVLVLVGWVRICVFAEISVGVKEGDWIEYQVTFTGSPPPPHLTWIKLEVIRVQGFNVTLQGTMTYSNGTQETPLSTVDLASEQLGEGFLISANVYTGDTIAGDITISGSVERTYTGVKRTVVYATTTQIILEEFVYSVLYWDVMTGVLVEGNQDSADYIMDVKTAATNMWQSSVFGVDPTVFYTLIIAAIAIVGTLGVVYRLARTSS